MFITMYSMELLRQQEITDTNMHMEAVMVTKQIRLWKPWIWIWLRLRLWLWLWKQNEKGNEDKTQESKTERQVKKDHE